jgi:hypothetical protein
MCYSDCEVIVMQSMPCRDSLALTEPPAVLIGRPVSRLTRRLAGSRLLWAVETWIRWKLGLLPADYLDVARALALASCAHRRPAPVLVSSRGEAPSP